LALTVSFFDVMTALIAALAVLACICFAVMRGRWALAWLAASLVIGAAEMQAMKIIDYGAVIVAIITFTVPIAHWCFAQALRATVNAGLSSRWLNGAIAALTGLSLAMLAAGADAFWQTLPFQIAAVIAVCDGARCIAQRRSSILDGAIVVTQICVALMLLLRVPILSPILGGHSHFSTATQDALLSDMLTAWAILGPISVALLIAKVVGGMVSSYRSRAERDDLTGLLNRAAFNEHLEACQDGVLILCDIDHFKSINDNFGHPVGDKVICRLSQILASQRGPAARIGGEEFALLLPGATMADALHSAEAARMAFRIAMRSDLPEAGAVSASFGIAPIRSGTSVQQVLAEADDALYRSKKQGRDRVSIYQSVKPRKPAIWLPAAA